MDIVLASGNLHKKRELSEILSPSGTRLLLPDEIGIDFYFEETEPTFLGNSLGKAQALYRQCRLPVLADDSGLVIPALDGAPGIYSARYGSDIFGRPLSDSERNRFLLGKMEGIADRSAFFVCCMTLMLDAYRIFTFQETFTGRIAHRMSGNGGFGYDPVFLVHDTNLTAAELSAAEKNRISHRGKAAAAATLILAAMNTT